jgi:hypothetical protein
MQTVYLHTVGSSWAHRAVRSAWLALPSANPPHPQHPHAAVNGGNACTCSASGIARLGSAFSTGTSCACVYVLALVMAESHAQPAPLRQRQLQELLARAQQMVAGDVALEDVARMHFAF